MGAPDRVGGGLAQAEMKHLALLDELGHRAHRLLDRHRPVDAVLVVQVDGVDVEPAERRLACAVNVIRPATDGLRPVGLTYEAELGRDHELVAPPRQRFADQLLVGEGAVHVGGVEHGDADFRSAIDGRDRLTLVAILGCPVEIGHAHAAEADCSNLEPLRPHAALLHWSSWSAARRPGKG